MSTSTRGAESLRIALAAVLTGVAGLSFASVFGGFGPALVLAVLAPSAAAALWALWARTGDRLSPGRTVLGVLGVCAAVGAATRPGSDVASGPYRLVTGALPADPFGPELAAASAATGFAALIGCYLAIGRRPALAPALPALICVLMGLGLGAATGGLPGWYPSVLVGLTGLLLLVDRMAAGPAGAAPRLRIVAAVVLGVGTVAAPLVTLAPGAGAHEPVDVRTLIAGPVAPKARTNPLAQFPALRDGPLLVEINGSASEPIERLRMVTMTEFDGRNWVTSADYRRAGHRLPPAKPATAVRRITMDVTVSNADTLGWLPTAGRAEHLSITGMGVDADTGDVVVPAGTSTPAAYRVTGVEPVFTGEELLSDEPMPAAKRLDLELPPDLLGFVATATSGEPTAAGRLLALYRALSSTPFGEDRSRSEAAGGHGLFQISALLRDKRGTSEQYASAFAVMCRQLGWDARVVLGFRPRWNGNELTVTPADVHAWVEVRFARLGWMPVDPTPRQASPGREPDNVEAAPRRDDPLDSVPDPGQAPPESVSPDEAPASATTGYAEPPPGLPLWVTAAIASGLLVVLTTAAPIARRLRRARRRRAGTHRARAIAAWREAIDALWTAGYRVPAGATSGEIVTRVGTHYRPALPNLASHIDCIAFAPEPASEGDVAAAWADSDLVRRAVLQQLRPVARLRAAIDPRPLLPGRR